MRKNRKSELSDNVFAWRQRIAAGISVGLILSFGPAAAQAGESARFTAKDMLDIVTVNGESITLSPDGKMVAFVYPDMDDEANVLSRRPTGYIHVRSIGGEQVEILGKGARHTSFPSWSPDSRYLAYFVEESDGTRLEVWDAESGEKRRPGSSFAGDPYLAPQWDSAGDRIVIARTSEPPESKAYLFPAPPTFTRAVRVAEDEEVPRVVVVDSSDERIPGDAVFADDRQATLAVVTLADGNETYLTEGPGYLRRFEVSPGGSQVIYSMPTEETFGIPGGEVLTTFLASLDGEYHRRLSSKGKQLEWGPTGDKVFYVEAGTLSSFDSKGENEGAFHASTDLRVNEFKWSPNGKWLALLVSDDTSEDPEIDSPREGMYSIARPFNDLYVTSAEREKAHNVTADLPDRLSDPVWSPDGSSLFFRAVDNETYDECIYEYEPGAAQLSRLICGKESFDSLETAGDTLLFTAESALHPPDLYAVDTNNGRRRQVTDWNKQLSRFEFSEPEVVHFVNGDGARLGALLYRPVGVEESAKVPVITYVYEKLTPGRNRFTARHQIFLNHGFAVLMPNVKVQVGETGTSFVKSVIPATAAVRSMGFTNGKFAIWGGSFGAFATAYIITQTDLFACAAARATPPDLFGNWASGRDRDSDNIEHGQARMGGSPYDVMKRYFAQSAFFHLEKVETPILIMHGAQDTTILFSEGEMLFYALRRLGKEAKLVAYTHGDHSLYRHSAADAVDVHERLLEWFDTCLK